LEETWKIPKQGAWVHSFNGIKLLGIKRSDRHVILIITWEDRMEDCVIIWHPMLFEDEIGHPIVRVVVEDKYSLRSRESKIRIVLMEHTLREPGWGMFRERQ